MLSDAEGDRSLKYDAVILLGDTETIAAAADLTQQTWRMHSFARGEAHVDRRIWREAYTDHRDARTRFYQAARDSLGVSPATVQARSTWLEYTQELQLNAVDHPDS